jgi:NADPH-dependent ferric siderophore reductase
MSSSTQHLSTQHADAQRHDSIVQGVAHGPKACKAARHTRMQHLITADESSLLELQTLLATLPICSTGRVFIEVPDAASIVTLDAPARMTVTWLDRSARSGAAGTGALCAPGRALTRAVAGWAGEMLCAPEADETHDAAHDHTRVYLTGGFLGTADIVDHLVEQRGVDPARIFAPARFGLSVASFTG